MPEHSSGSRPPAIPARWRPDACRTQQASPLPTHAVTKTSPSFTTDGRVHSVSWVFTPSTRKTAAPAGTLSAARWSVSTRETAHLAGCSPEEERTEHGINAHGIVNQARRRPGPNRTEDRKRDGSRRSTLRDANQKGPQSQEDQHGVQERTQRGAEAECRVRVKLLSAHARMTRQPHHRRRPRSAPTTRPWYRRCPRSEMIRASTGNAVIDIAAPRKSVACTGVA